LAENAPIKPFVSASQADYAVDGQTVTFTFDSPWSLLQMVSAHEDVLARNDAKPGVNVLAMTFPWRSTSISAQALALKGEVKVLLGFELSPHKASSLLLWPRNFPTAAPQASY
jgi:hypothetical protein